MKNILVVIWVLLYVVCLYEVYFQNKDITVWRSTLIIGLLIVLFNFDKEK